MKQREETVYQLHAEICKTLAHACRIEIIDHLREGEMQAGELARLMGVSKANLSQHLAILRRNGIVETRREGAYIFYRISSPKVVRACQLMREVLIERLNMSGDLAKMVEETA
ncbi:MAG TPA: metalloregulator ArsR/SmtB family transcription factor [bacterium]|jgi:ArsR family transcriptional regulator